MRSPRRRWGSLLLGFALLVLSGIFATPAAAQTAALSGTVTDDNEADIRAGGSTIILTLTGETWRSGGFTSQRQAIIDGLVSAQGEAAGWNNEVQPNIPTTNVVRTSDTVVTISLPSFAAYDITATETITATIPASALAGSSPIVAAPAFNITAISAALSGTVTDDSEADIRAGGSTLILTLNNDTWVADDGTFAAQRQNIIDGLDSAQAEAAGWDAVVKAGLAVTDVVRTSDTVVTVMLPAFGGYDITVTETITATIPDTAVVGDSAIVAAPTFDITAISAALSGTVTDDSEIDIRAGGSTIILTLTGDTWVAAGGTFDGQRQNIIDGIDSAQVEAAGWDAVVKAGLAVDDVVRTSNTVVTVTLPALATYDITATETITATIPTTAVAGDSAIVAAPTFDVTFDSPWFHSDWPSRKAVTLDGSTFCKSVNAFPVPVILGSDAELAADALPGGLDILFTADDGITKLPHEIEKFDDSTGELVAWVKLDIVSSTDQTLYMYYGNNGAADQQDLPGLWDDNFVRVFHLEEDVNDESTAADIHQDSTGTDNGTQINNVEITGQIADAQDFDGTGDYVDIGLVGGITNAVTVSGWVKHNNLTNTIERHVSLSDEVVIRHDGVNSTGQLHAYVRSDATTYHHLRVNGVLADDTWYHVAQTYDGTTQRLYLDGVEQASQLPGAALLPPDGVCKISHDSTSMNGIIDEIRISNIARSPDWLEAEVCTAGGVVGGIGPPQYPAVTSALAEIAPNAVGAGSTANSFTYDILPTVGASDTGVNQVVISAPAGYASLNVTAVSLGGTGKSLNCPAPVAGQYCASITGQDITVTLGDQGGNGQVIQVVFDADAPGAPGSASFTSTVDDTATSTPAQATNTGNADGDGADNNSWTVTVSAATAALSGTVTDDSEADIRTGGSIIVLTLTGDTWVAAGGTFDAERQNIINGLDSAQAEAAGWDAVVKAGLNVTDVVRTSDTVVTVTLPAFATYDITATETVTATISATAVTGGSPIVAAPTFDVLLLPTAALTGTVTDDSELDIRAGGSTLILTLTDDTWVATGGTFDAQRQNIIDGLDSAQAEAAGWDAVVKAGLNVGDVVRTSATVVTVTLPAFGAYDLTTRETITATIPATAVVGGSPIVAAPAFDVTVYATAAVTGTVTDDIEQDIRSGGSTIILTLTDDTWVAAGAAFDAQRQNIIDGLDSTQAEAAGWDAVVKAGLNVGDVVRTSATVVTVTLPAFGGYDITATETITATIPATAVVGGSAIVASPTFDVAAITAALSGTVTGDNESDIRAGGSTLILTLTNDTWVATGGAFEAQRQNIIDGLDSAQAEATGWDAVVKAGLAVTDVVRTSDTVVTVTLPAFGGYNITSTEFITATIPATAVADGSAIVATPTFDVTADTNWYDSNWLYRKTINLDGATFCTTVNAFPVPITLTGDTDLQADARPDGFDILFTADDGLTKLSHEIETFDDTNGDLVAWVKLDIVSSMDKTLYMYYGNSSAADQQDAPGVWDSNFEGVWHMTEEAAGTGNTGVYKDSTSNANHGDDDVSATGQTGQINGGQEFDGTDDQVNFGSGASLNIRNAITMSAWVDMSSRPTKDDWFNLLGKESFPYHFYMYGRDTNLTTLGAYFELDTGNADLWDVTSIDIDPANGWAHVAVTLDGTDIKFYVNGALDHTENEPGIIDDSTGIDLVFTDDESLWFAGSVDEIRISDTALSADWIQAEVCTAGGVVGGTGPPEYPAVTTAVAEIAPNAVGVGSTANAFTYDIRPTIGVNNTGVNQVVITAPAGYASLSVTGVSVGGSGLTAGGSCPSVGAVEYCASVAAPDITVSLGTKVTVSGTNIKVNFTADAPGSSGTADFTSTVDDTATSSSAQNAVEGDGNNDGGTDGDDWTVTVGDNAVTTALAEITPNDVPIFSLANSFAYDIAFTVGGSDTGVDRVEVTVPATFGDPTVTDVLVGGASIGAAYTDNTAGKLISIVLDTQLFATNRIGVVFTADGPAAVDGTGKDFISTVDDSTTPTPAQATAEGNGDADGGDANDWTVTASNGNLVLVKKAYFFAGTQIANGATIPQGTPIKFMIYINNRSAARGDVSLQDVLDAAFGYQTGSMKVTNAVGECAADTCTALEEDAIFTAVSSGTVVTDAVDDPDVGSITGATIDVGDEVVGGNGQLDISANSVWALVFSVVMN